MPMNDTPRLLGGRYEIGELLGRGGMAEVHRGYDHRLGRPVAIKLLRTDLARDPSFQVRFRREAQSAASLNHPSIVAVYDTGEDAGLDEDSPLPYIVMEYVDGTTLRELLDDGRRLLPQRAVEISEGVLEALSYSHRQGIIHRDIKPANVMLTRTGEVKVMDFGIARAMADAAATMTQTSAVIGTAQYLSPEQARGEPVDQRSDVYSLGCLLYELLTGRPPFVGDSPVSVAYQHVREQPLPPSALDPDITADIDAVVLKSLAKDRAERYQSAADMRADLQHAISGEPVAAPPAPPAATQRLPRVAVAALGSTLPEPREDDEPRSRGRIWAYLLLGLAVVAVFSLSALFGSRLLSPSAPKTVVVPNVVGFTEAKARAAITGVGLSVGQVTQQADALPAGTVLKTVPVAGTAIQPSATAVALVVSSGPNSTTVPTLVGVPLSQAQQALVTAGLKLGTVTQRDSDQPANQVLQASQSPGARVPNGTAVDLVVASGNNVVPNVTGADLASATATLTSAGFQVNSISQFDAANRPGTVLDQTPAADTSRPLGSSVTLTVAAAPPSPTPSSSSPGPTGTSTAPGPGPTSPGPPGG